MCKNIPAAMRINLIFVEATNNQCGSHKGPYLQNFGIQKITADNTILKLFT